MGGGIGVLRVPPALLDPALTLCLRRSPCRTEEGTRLTSTFAPYIQMEVAVPFDIAGDCLLEVSGERGQSGGVLKAS